VTFTHRWRRGAAAAFSALLIVLPLTFAGAHAAGLAKRHRPAPRDPGQTQKQLGTFVLGGSMDANVTVTMTGGFSIGQLTQLDWDLPLASNATVGGYNETVNGADFSWSEPPTSSQDISYPTVATDVPVRRFHWDTPNADTPINLTETLHLTVHTDLSPFSSSAPYPMAQVPSTASPYLGETDHLQLPSSADSLIQTFKKAGATEQAVVNAVQDWVASNTVYQNQPNQPFDATWVFQNHRANCEGFDDVMSGILRKLGIPARTEFGWVSANPLSLPGPNNSKTSLAWSIPGTQGELHTWMNVWFPDAGWVSFDPQEEKFFSDVRHLAFFSNVDAQVPDNYGVWSAFEAGNHDFGKSFSTGAQLFVPGDGITSKVQLTTTDHFAVSFRSLQKDVSSLVMFGR
jgi:hypothetical protein